MKTDSIRSVKSFLLNLEIKRKFALIFFSLCFLSLSAFSNGTISGKVTDNAGNPIQNVSILFNGGNGVVTASDGTYSNALNTGTYSVTATLAGFTFSTVSNVVVASGGGHTYPNINFNVPLANTSTITGRITYLGNSLSNVVVTLSRPGTSTTWTATTSAANPNFSITAPDIAGTNYTETPVLAGYSFSPSPRAFTMGGNLTLHDYTATALNCTISGTITAAGVNLQGATVTATYLTNTWTTTSANDGTYSIVVPAWGAGTRNFTITAAFNGFTFNSTTTGNINQYDTDNGNNLQTQNSRTITGRITNLSGASVSGVLVTLSKTGTSTVWTATSNGANPNFTITAPNNTVADYTELPTPPSGYTFTPLSRTSFNMTGNLTGHNYTYATGTLSGTVTQTGSGLHVPGVTISINSNPTVTATTDANGAYSVTVPAGTWTVTATNSGFNLTPNPANGVVVAVNGTTTQNFSMDGGVVTGTVTGAGAATVTIDASGAGGYSTTTSGSTPYYLFLPAGTRTLTPSANGYTFTPGSFLVTVVNGGSITQNLAASDCGRIWGHVYVNGTPQAFFPVHLTGYNQRTVLTDASGMYEFTNLPVPGNGTCGVGGGIGAVNYTVNIQPYGTDNNNDDLFYALQLTGSGDAVNHDFNINALNTDALNFNIGGQVTLSGSGATPQAGVSMQLYQRTPGLPDVPANWTSIGTTTTDASGNYLFTHVGAGNNTTANIVGYTSYRVIASKSGFAYSPTDGTHGDNGYIYISDLPGDQLTENFQAAPKPNVISGKITIGTSGGAGLADVVVNITGTKNYTAATGSDGTYSVTIDPGTYTITPDSTSGSGIGYNFAPTTRNVTITTSDAPGQDFVANIRTGLTITGKIYNSGALMTTATIRLRTDNVITNTIAAPNSGNYSFTGLTAHKKYEVIVDQTGFTFIPQYVDDGISPDSSAYGYKLYSDMVTSQVQDFATNINSAIITGTIKTAPGSLNVPVSNITVAIVGATTFNTSAVTGLGGVYTAQVPKGQTYTITPQITPDQGYNFIPASVNPSVTIVNPSYTYDFEADTTIYNISGIVSGISTDPALVSLYDYTGMVPPGVFVASIPATNNVTYTFNNVKGLRNYMIVPLLGNYTFNPNNRAITNLIGLQPNQNFSAQTAIGPQLTIPTNNATCVVGLINALRPTFSWTAPAPPAPMPTSYKIQIAPTPDFALMVGGSDVPATSGWTATSDLKYGTTYYWRVEGLSAFGNNWSTVSSFTMKLAPPTLVGPANATSASTQPTFNWLVDTGATSYQLEVYSDPSCSVNVFTTVQSKTNYTPTAGVLLSGMKYYWRVEALSGTCQSSYSSVWNFTTDAKIPILKSPLNGATGVLTSPTLEWYKSDGAVSYDVQYSTTPDFSSNVTPFLGVTGLTQPISGLTIAKTYFWRVRANGPISTTDWSSIWSFRTATGLIAVNPTSLDFGTLVVNRVLSKNVSIYNQGNSSLRITNLSLTGTGAAQFVIDNSFGVIEIAPGNHIDVPVKFNPKVVGTFAANLVIDHNDISSETNPVIVPLTGSSIPTAVTLSLPSTLNFGNVAYLSGPTTKKFVIANNSTVPGDILNVSSYYFETVDGRFSISTPFPIVLEPGSSDTVTVQFNPISLGTQTNKLHIINTSLNAPDAVITTVGTVIQGGLIVIPTSLDFGNTSVANPFKIDSVTIQNNSAANITISDKNVTGDVTSFLFEKNGKPLTLAPNQTDTVIVKFMPPTIGRKNGILNILSNDPIAPHLYIPMTGIGGEFPVLSAVPLEINFGDIAKAQTKDTTVILRNDGSLDLVISGKSFTGTDKALFSFVNDGSPVTLRHGETENVVIRITGDLPVGAKNAKLEIASNDPNNPIVSINLLAFVKTPSLSALDKIEFDSVGVGYYVDSTVTIMNNGNISAIINKLTFDGAFASDFSIVNTTLPLEVKAAKGAPITIRFKPMELGLRYARLIVASTDPFKPEIPIIIKGYGKNVSSAITVNDGDGKPLSDGLDFGNLVIFESKTLGLLVTNLSKYAKLRIDSIFLTTITDQPFSWEKWTMPFVLGPGNSKLLNVTFNPRGLQRSYTGFINLKFSDSTASPSTGAVIPTKLKGHVIFPGSKVNLPPVLPFGRVLLNQTKTVPFTVSNRGEAYLKIDSIVFAGADAAEFKVASPLFPQTVDPDKDITIQVTFSPKKVGTKDAKLTIYWNDVFTSGDVSISAEGYTASGQTTGITALGDIPTVFALKQNYPNPFNPSTKIEYSVPENSFVSVKVYNSVGQLVATLVNENQEVGTYRLDWNAKNIPTGMYFYRMETSKFTSIKKMLLIK
jgi:hypothetical protein